jgi:hypothetical protein
MQKSIEPDPIDTRHALRGARTTRSPGAFERSEKAVRWSVLLSFSVIHHQPIP